MSTATAEQQSKQLSQREDPKFLCGVAVSVYQNSGKFHKKLPLLRLKN